MPDQAHISEDGTPSGGPLTGLKVLELGGIGPGPFAAMLLSDMGADVVRVDRPGPESGLGATDVLQRGRRSVVLDLRREESVAVLLQLVEQADVLIEGYRPGVAERLGVGPEDCLARNPRIVYGRMTGWGQSGPWAQMAGHDINYVALTGALNAIGRAGEPPAVPVNMLGDFGAGSTYLVMGVLAALWESRSSGRGQVVDAAIVDGAASLTTMLHGMLHAGSWKDERGVNLLDTGRPWYDVYETSDGRWMTVGALESKFYGQFVTLLGLPEQFARRPKSDGWPELRKHIAERFRSKTQAEWTAVFECTDACVAPVLTLGEAAEHPHLRERQTFVDIAGVRQPAPAPRFDRTPGAVQRPPATLGEHTLEVLTDWGLEGGQELIARGIAGNTYEPAPN
ncbi:CoA transferase [Rhodococcus pseudokoreensis]|uniref:CoA transferase n=1 Tax=Rhodococcus pseudokoreensis TaxID=2811421 RepID=A0A974W6C9_9NOCA|nr:MULTISPECIES: CaiB/BaiF CoA-transferase family protein [Rhodococcus]OUS92233.1 carnitine dehydratase [Rhodococcus sp. NCIMB 12038]QSE92069.1 CoA transferase [Rhodococcus pseudokoreensis]